MGTFLDNCKAPVWLIMTEIIDYGFNVVLFDLIEKSTCAR